MSADGEMRGEPSARRRVVLNPAVCPKCREKRTTRIGTALSGKESLWVCENAGCGHRFAVQLLSLSKR